MPHELAGAVLTTEEAVRRGVTKRQLQGPAWASPVLGVHHDASLEDTPRLRARCVARVLPSGALIARRWAAQLHGADVLTGDETAVEVVVPEGVRSSRRRGLRCRSSGLAPRDRSRAAGVPVTSPLRTACDVARYEPLVVAVVVLDALLALGLVDPPQVLAELGRWHGRRNVARARRAVLLCRPRVESPMETRLRLILVLAGLAEPVVQHEIFVAGGFLARVDLAYPHLCVAIEYDGGVHDDPRQNAKDTARLTALEAAGWTVLRFRAVDVYRRRDRVVAQVQAATAVARASRA